METAQKERRAAPLGYEPQARNEETPRENVVPFFWLFLENEHDFTKPNEQSTT